MARTPDRFPGTREDEEVYLENQGPGGLGGGDPTVVGSTRYVTNQFRQMDGLGVFNPRSIVSSASDPTAAADGASGYPVGMLWLNTTTFIVFVSRSSATAAAIWVPLNEGLQLKALKGTAGTLTLGQAVYVTGYDDATSSVRVELAQANSVSTMDSIGLVSDASITDAVPGLVQINGTLGGLNTSTFAINDTLYVSSAAAGGLVTTVGTIPQAIATVAKVHASAGQLVINSQARELLSNASPQAVGAVAAGTSGLSSRSDHIHAHGDQAGGTLHAAATTSVAGFMASGDKTKLDGVATGATNTPLSSTAPEDVTKATAVIGVGTTAARADHKHNISTAAPVDVTKAAAAEGTATSLARSDHKHDILTGTPVAGAVQVGGSAGEGTATSLARSDHTHAVSAGTPVDVTKAANSAGVATTFARSDHKHDISTAVPIAGAVAVGNAAGEGTATSLARSDHTHTVSAGTPVDVTKAANAAGVATTFARSDHKHDVTTAAPVDVTKATAAEGTATSLARSDHKHDISTAVPIAGAVAVGNAAAEGTATSLARSDHTHTVSAGTPVDVTKAANAAGVATTFARSDHKHDVTTAAPVNVTKATAAEGTATSLARSDHKHDVTTAAAVAVGTANAEGAATSLARSDHTHQVTGLVIASEDQGDVLYRNASAWVRLPAGTSGQYLQTLGTGANPAWAPVDVQQHFEGYDATGGGNITGTPLVVPLNTERIKDSIYTHSTVTDNGEVTVTATGRYVVTAQVSTQITASTVVSASEMYLELDTGGGFNEVAGTRGIMFNFETDRGGTQASRTFVLNLTNGNKIRVSVIRTSGTATISLEANASGLTIESRGIFSALPSSPAHASAHILNGSDEIDGDQLGITHVPANYTRTTVAEASLTGHLTAHLAGISVALGTKVTGPASATDNAITRFDATTGKLVQNSGVTISDTNAVAGMLTGTFVSEGAAGNSGAGTFNVDFSTLGQKVSCTLTGNCTFTFTFPAVGNYVLRITQDGTGSRTPVLPATMRAASGSVSLSSAASSITVWAIYWNGTNSYVSSMPSASTATVALV